MTNKVTITIEARADDGRMAEIAVETDFHGDPPPSAVEDMQPVHLLAIAAIQAMSNHAAMVANEDQVSNDPNLTPTERVEDFQSRRMRKSKEAWGQ